MEKTTMAFSQDKICQRQTLSQTGNQYFGYVFLDWHPIDDIARLPLELRFKNFAARLERALYGS